MTRTQVATWSEALVQGTTTDAAAELAWVHRLANVVAAEPPLSTRMPALVLTSRAYGRRWAAWQQQVAEELGASLRLSGDRSHNIRLRHPDLVANGVREIQAAVEHAVRAS